MYHGTFLVNVHWTALCKTEEGNSSVWPSPREFLHHTYRKAPLCFVPRPPLSSIMKGIVSWLWLCSQFPEGLWSCAVSWCLQVVAQNSLPVFPSSAQGGVKPAHLHFLLEVLARNTFSCLFLYEKAGWEQSASLLILSYLEKRSTHSLVKRCQVEEHNSSFGLQPNCVRRHARWHSLVSPGSQRATEDVHPPT